MKETEMLIGLVLTILALVLMYKSIRCESSRLKIEKLAETFASIESQIKRFSCLLDEMATSNEGHSALKCRTAKLQEIVEELEHRKNELEASNRSMADINGELERNNAGLIQRATLLRDEIRQDELAIQKAEEYLDSLRRIKEGLEIALNNIQAEEVHFLSEPVFSLGVTPSIKSHLEAHGISYIGDLIHLNERFLMEIWGIGPATIEKIKTKLNESGGWFGMDVIRVNNHWYRRKQAPTTD